MKHKLKRLIWTIEDHIKDSGYDLKNAKREKEEQDTDMENFYIQSAKQRLDWANKGLDRYGNIVRDYETRERQNGHDRAVIEEKAMAWRCVCEILEERVKHLTKEISEM